MRQLIIESKIKLVQILLVVSVVVASPVASTAAFASDGKDSEQQVTRPTTSSEDQDETPELAKKHPWWFKRMLRKASSFKLRYYFLAQNTHNCDFFYGLVEDNPFIGRAAVKFAFPNGCDCHGVAQVTHYPLGGPTSGQRGYIKAKCTDGRTIKGHFKTTSLTTGDGTVSDSLGNEYQFTFGHTAEESVKAINELRKKLNCPELTPEDIELKVQARIVSPH